MPGLELGVRTSDEGRSFSEDQRERVALDGSPNEFCTEQPQHGEQRVLALRIDDHAVPGSVRDGERRFELHAGTVGEAQVDAEVDADEVERVCRDDRRDRLFEFLMPSPPCASFPLVMTEPFLHGLRPASGDPHAAGDKGVGIHRPNNSAPGDCEAIDHSSNATWLVRGISRGIASLNQGSSRLSIFPFFAQMRISPPISACPSR